MATPPKIDGVLETCLYVEDMSKAHGFYDRVFGFEAMVVEDRIVAMNVGPRQAGRDRGRNVLDSDYGRASVAAAIGKVRHRRGSVSSEACRIYGDGRSGRRIASILARVKLDRQLRQKKSTD